MPQDATPAELQHRLAEVAAWTRRTRRHWRHRGVAYLFWLWGAIWSIGYGGLFVWGEGPRAAWLWLALWALGGLGTAAVYLRYGWRVRAVRTDRQDRPAFWPLNLLFMALMFVVRPPHSMYRDGTVVALWILWAYAVLGWQVGRPFYTRWAVVMAGLTVAGFGLLPQRPFYLWMAVVGGLTWLAGGVYQRRGREA